jgi:hypothetical protein
MVIHEGLFNVVKILFIMAMLSYLFQVENCNCIF